ncbi:hypothetical protein AVEN_64981-1 [Araneus ventricosus]|uniref:Tc1-like transposase DDE domain-containing protein n=1 Tax=Araneus ventricosus TaxID=182803 RepID=A0A4Y2TWJ7_ARAVE|nr:hypothetical protein AVEN_64981-1 [Araneus ventricosus]
MTGNTLSGLTSIVFKLYWAYGRVRQDNTTPHTSRGATEWLQEHSSDFRHFHWPNKSPDMNIIEYIWDALQLALHNTSEPPRFSMNLWTALHDLWRELPPGYLQALDE